MTGVYMMGTLINKELSYGLNSCLKALLKPDTFLQTVQFCFILTYVKENFKEAWCNNTQL